MAKPSGATPVGKGYGDIRIEGLSEFVKAIKAGEDKEAPKALKEANKKTARFVIAMARREASDKMQRAAAKTLKESSALGAVKVIGGSTDVPYFGGANFGAYRDLIRLIKAPTPRQGGQRRTRATLVRRGEDFNKVAQRVEAQSVDTRGRTIPRNPDQRVRLARTSKGDIRKIHGWNQFGKQEWKKGEDRFLYRAIRKNYEEITEFYFAALEQANLKAFPD